MEYYERMNDLACGQKVGALYMTSRSSNVIAITKPENDAKLWHYKLGHMSQKGIKTFCP